MSFAATNSYIIWRHLCDKEVKEKRCIPTYYSHVEFLEKLVLQLIWSEIHYNKTRNDITQVSTITTLTRATNRTETWGTDTRNNTINKTRFFNRRVQALTEHTFTTCFPNRLDREFLPCLPTTVLKPYQYCQYKERLSNSEARKVIPNTRRHRIEDGNLV